VRPPRPQRDGARRTCLEGVHKSTSTHIGLWLDRYLKIQNDQNHKTDDDPGIGEKANHIKSVENTPVPNGYLQAFERWRESFAADHHTALITPIKASGRIALGLGTKGVLENGIHLDHTWGVPVIPGSALKGLAAATAHQLTSDDRWRKGTAQHAARGTWHAALFGQGGAVRDGEDATDHIGRVKFHDAWWDPTGAQTVPIALDTMTVHHPKYYQGEAAPLDTDSPNPVPFATLHGTFLLALELTDPGDDPGWLDRAYDLLKLGLVELGIGAKTNAGYGRMTIEAPEKSRRTLEAEYRETLKTPEERWLEAHGDLRAASTQAHIEWLLRSGQTPPEGFTLAAWQGLLSATFPQAIAALQAQAIHKWDETAALPDESLLTSQKRALFAFKQKGKPKDKKEARKWDEQAAQMEAEIKALEDAPKQLEQARQRAAEQVAIAAAFLAWLRGGD